MTDSDREGKWMSGAALVLLMLFVGAVLSKCVPGSGRTMQEQHIVNECVRLADSRAERDYCRSLFREG